MGLFAMSDLHLSSDNKKSMEVFGDKWIDYMKRIKTNWESIIKEEDTIIIPGDISWATYLDESIDDFKYLDALPGKKIIIKGNHDYWWTTVNKMNKFLDENGFKSISFLQNNSFVYDGMLICGTRLWICPSENGFSEEDRKIFDREIQRLRLSLDSGKEKGYEKVVVSLHYPPFDKDKVLDRQVGKLLNEYGAKLCLYGHLHGPSHKEAFEGEQNGIEFRFVSADYLEFMPLKIY